MTQLNASHMSIAEVQEMLRRELSTSKRIGYLLLFMLTLTAAGLVGTLWLTETRPLPMRTHLAFAVLVAINLAWSALFGWIVMRRKVLFAAHSVIAGWMAVAFCGLFLAAGLMVAVSRMNIAAIIAVSLLGVGQVLVALALLRRARRRRSYLLSRRHELTGTLEKIVTNRR
jgi:hypothetical protein